MNLTNHKIVVISLILLIAGIIGAGIFIAGKKEAGEKSGLPGNGKENPIACTEEAKLCPDGSYVARSGPKCEFAKCPEIVGIEDKITISSPRPKTKITSPVLVQGKARGIWFFEGSFPVEVYDSNEKLLGSGPAEFVPRAEDETWMTVEFISFRGEIKFTKPSTETGYILFRKDNPSDQRELDESVKLPVSFQ